MFLDDGGVHVLDLGKRNVFRSTIKKGKGMIGIVDVEDSRGNDVLGLGKLLIIFGLAQIFVRVIANIFSSLKYLVQTIKFLADFLMGLYAFDLLELQVFPD